jgi:hypothetical protein
MAKPAAVFKVWTILLSTVFGVLLFTNILDKHGFWRSLFFTALGISFIWMMYFAIGKLIDWVVSEELKRMNKKGHSLKVDPQIKSLKDNNKSA